MAKRKGIKVIWKKKGKFWKKVWKVTKWTSLVLGSVGLVNWGLFGAFNMNLVTYLKFSWLIKSVYVAMGLSAPVLLAWTVPKLFKER